MNKTLLLICSFFACIYLQGQTSGHFIIRLDGNYNENSNANALQWVNSYEATTKNGEISLSVGYLYHKWLFGAGFEYGHMKTNSQGGLYYQMQGITFADTQESFISIEMASLSMNSIGGKLYTSYYLPLCKNLYFTPAFYVGLGKIKGTNSSVIFSDRDLNEDGILSTSSSLWEYERDISNPYLAMQLSPELTWFFSDHFGINLQTGGFGFMVVDYDWENSTKQINFNPANWNLGVLLKF